MALYELSFLYFLIGSTVPILLLCMSPDDLGAARLASGLDEDSMLTAAMLLWFFCWPLVMFVWALVLSGVINLKDYR
jgi:positive regulator of sigma E activity